jgi:hypothetical protein
MFKVLQKVEPIVREELGMRAFDDGKVQW